MNYIIKSPKDGWYFTRFIGNNGTPEFGRIMEAKIYSSKIDALKDLRKMEQCGQRVIAITRVGMNIKEQKNSSSQSNF